MPSQSPTRAATAALRSRDGKSASVGGREPSRRLLEHGAPAVAEPVHARSRRARPRGASAGRCRRHRRPTSGTAGCAAPPHSASPTPVLGAVPGRGQLDDDPAARVEHLAQPAQQRDRVAADADVAVGEQRGVPAALARQRRRRRRGAAPRRRGRRVRPTASWTTSMPRTTCPRSAERLGQPARAAADVEGRARRRGRAWRGPSARRPGAVPVVEAQERCTAGSTGSALIAPTSRPGPGELGVAGGRRATSVRVRDGVDVAQRRGRSPTSSPSPLERARGCRRTSSASTSARRASARAAAGSRSAEHPPAAVLGRAEHGVVRRRARRRPSCRSPGVSCGVSMPTWTTGPPGGTSACALTSRSAKAAPALRRRRASRRARDAISSPRTASARSPASASRQRAGAERRRGRPRWCRAAAAAASSAAAAMPTSAPEPGLDPARRPAPSRPRAPCAASRQHPPEVAGGAGRAAHRAGHLRAGALGARVVGDVALDDPPAGRASPSAAARPGSRTAGPARRGRAARRGGRPASARCRGRPSRSGGAATRRPGRCRARACQGQTPRATGRRRPTARSARPDRDVVEQRQQVGGVERAVAVHDRDVVAGRGEQARVHGGAVARASARCTTVAPSRRATSAVPSVDPLSTTITANAGGHRGQQRPASAAASSRHGRTRSQTDRHVSTVGAGRPRTAAATPYGPVTPIGAGPAARRHLGSDMTSAGSRGPRLGRGLAGRCSSLVARRRSRLPPLARTGRSRPAPRATRRRGEVPPLHGYWEPTSSGPARCRRSLLALLGWRYAADLADAAALAPAAAGVVRRGLAWLLSLALVDGTDGLSRVLGNPYEYLRDRPRGRRRPRCCSRPTSTGSPTRPTTTGRPTWPATRPGRCCSSSAWCGSGSAATSRPALVVTAARRHDRGRGAGDAAGARRRGRRPAGRAVPGAHPGRGVHGGLRGRGVRRGHRVGAGRPRARRHHGRRADRSRGPRSPGCCSGCCVLMSYGLPLLGILALAVLVAARLVAAAAGRGAGRARRSCWPSPRWASRGGRPTRCCASATGTASPPTGPTAYWLWGNLAALAVCAGPLLGAGPRAVDCAAARATAVVLLLVGAGGRRWSSSPTCPG